MHHSLSSKCIALPSQGVGEQFLGDSREQPNVAIFTAVASFSHWKQWLGGHELLICVSVEQQLGLIVIANPCLESVVLASVSQCLFRSIDPGSSFLGWSELISGRKHKLGSVGLEQHDKFG